MWRNTRRLHMSEYKTLHKNAIDLSGLFIEQWEVLGYLGDSMWKCRCSCGAIKSVAGKSLRKRDSKSCGHDTKKMQDLKGMIFGEWEVLSYSVYENRRHYWNCKCSCGNERVLDTFALTSGHSTSCGHNKLIDITGETFGKLVALEYIGNKTWACECSCGAHKNILGKDLRSGKVKSCGHYEVEDLLGNKEIRYKENQTERLTADLTGETIGDWKVLEYSGNSKYKCECLCGTIRDVSTHTLTHGLSKSCGHNTSQLKDIKGAQFGELKALRYIGSGLWECECSCGNTTTASGYELRYGIKRSCNNYIHRVIDISGKVFGELRVIEYRGKNIWHCRCSCGTEVDILGANLRSGGTRSCGCKTVEMRNRSLVRNGHSNRDREQEIAITSKVELHKFLRDLNYKPTSNELADELGITKGHLLNIIHKYELDEYILLNPSISQGEKELYNFILGLIDNTHEVVQSDRSVLNGMELDVYIPDLKLAMEFNGTYWHSSVKKAPKYHQNKTMQCAQKGIRLIHVFEYEWTNADRQSKVKAYLKSILQGCTQKIYARKTEIQEITYEAASKIEDLYHLQGKARSSINIGMVYNDEVIAVMSFGKPRFNRGYEYELIRYCCKSDVAIVGGAERLFKYFRTVYEPQSIVCYTDVSKFTGKVYTRLGFKVDSDSLTAPNYVWAEPCSGDILTRYKTQKRMLIDNNLGLPEETEDEIMDRLGYFKIHDSGNLKLSWHSEISS